MTTDGERTEAPAEARAVRRTAVAAVAVFVLLAGGFLAWLLTDRNGDSGEVVADREVPESPPSQATGEPTQTPTAVPAQTPSNNALAPPSGETPTPAELSTGPILEWTEFDPGFELAGPLQSFGDGRVIVTVTDYDEDGWASATTRLLVTVDGTDWTEIPMPVGISPTTYDLSGDRWLVAGFDLPKGPGTTTDETEDELEEDNGDWRLPRQLVFYSDDQGATWTELEVDIFSGQPEASSTDGLITASQTSGEYMVIVLQGEEPIPISDQGTSAGREETTGGNPLARIFASSGGPFEQVAAYNGWIMGFGLYGSLPRPARSDGFSLQLVRGNGDRQDFSQLTSPDGWTWSEKTSTGLLFWPPSAAGPHGSVWSAAWSEDAFNIQRVDRDGAQTTTSRLRNLMPFSLEAGPSGLATTAFTPIMPSGRVAKDGYELRANEPEGHASLWDLSEGSVLYEFGPEILTEGFPEGVREIEQPFEDEYLDAVVLVFEDPETGADLVSFTREDLRPVPLFFMAPIEDSPQPEIWVGWSADGVDWGWQTLADAFGSETFGLADPWAELAVGDGFVLAQVDEFSDTGELSEHWFIARVP